jgi:hypothetical protein
MFANLQSLTVSGFHEELLQLGYRNNDNSVQQRDKMEKEIINSAGGTTCRKDTLISNMISLDNVDFDALQVKLRDKFLDPTTMYEALCLYQSITTAPSIGSGTPIYERVTRYLDHLFRVGASSVNGIVALSDTGNKRQGESTSSVIMKTPLTKNAEEDFTHELFVGAFNLNKVRNVIPNFALVYASFRCNPPLLAFNDKKVVDFCTTDDPSVSKEYILYENLFESDDVSTKIKTHKFDHIFNYFLQIVYSEIVAVKMTGFTHYDLHTENVLIRPLPSKMVAAYLNYDLPGGELMLVPSIATFIDYGYSRVEYNGQSYGKHGLETYGVDPSKSNIIYDFFKFAMFIAGEAISYNNKDVISGMTKLIHIAFFPSQDFTNFSDGFYEFVEESRKTFHSFPFDTPVDFDAHEFAMRIRNAFPNHNKTMFKSRSNSVNFPIVEFPSFPDLDKGAVEQLNEMTGKHRIPTDVVGFEDVYTYLQNLRDTETYIDRTQELMEQMINSFDYTKAFSGAENEIKELIKEADNLSTNIIPDALYTKNLLERTIDFSVIVSNNVHAHFLRKKAVTIILASLFTKDVFTKNGTSIEWEDKRGDISEVGVDKIVKMIQVLDQMVEYGSCRTGGYTPLKDMKEEISSNLDRVAAQKLYDSEKIQAIRQGIHEYAKLFYIPYLDYTSIMSCDL